MLVLRTRNMGGQGHSALRNPQNGAKRRHIKTKNANTEVSAIHKNN